MKLFGYEFTVNRAKSLESRSVCPPGGENSFLADYLGLSGTYTGVAVNDNAILGVSPMWAAIRYISEGIAALQSGVLKKTTDGIFDAPEHPVSRLFTGRVSPYYTKFDFFQALIANACLGDGYARIYYDANMRPSTLELIPRELVRQEFAPNGQLYHYVSGTLNGRTISEMVPDYDMVHLKGFTFNAINGKQIRAVHADNMEAAIASQKYTSAFFGNGAHVAGIVEVPGQLNPQDREKLRANIDSKYGGISNTGKTMVLDGGMKYQPAQMNPQEAALIDFRKLTVEDVSRITKVPLHMLSQLDRSTFSNMEQQSVDYVVHCLTPWVKKLEAEISTKLFYESEVRSGRYFYRFNLNSMMRADAEGRSKFYASAIQNGWMTQNEVRALENMNRIDDADRLYIQQNMMPVDMIEEVLSGKSTGTDSEAEPGTPATDNEDNNNEDESASE